MAVYSQVAKLRCIVCINGSHVQPIDGSVEQILSFFNKNAEKNRFNNENQVICRDLLLPIPTDPSLKVDQELNRERCSYHLTTQLPGRPIISFFFTTKQVGQLQCPLLLVVGEDDQNWPAHESAMDIKEMMERAGNSHLLTLLSYPDAGHLIEPPFTPFAKASSFRDVSSRQMLVVLWGGETAGHSRAQEDAWRKMLVFLRANLYGGANTDATSFSNL